jgi:hypothetical protein
VDNEIISQCQLLKNTRVSIDGIFIMKREIAYLIANDWILGIMPSS